MCFTASEYGGGAGKETRKTDTPMGFDRVNVTYIRQAFDSMLGEIDETVR